MDTLGLVLKIIGAVCLFVGMCMAGYLSASANKLPRDPNINMDGYGGAYLGIASTVIIFGIANIVLCYVLGWLNDKNLDMVWQAASAALALVMAFTYFVPVVGVLACSSYNPDSTIGCKNPARQALYVLSAILALAAGVLFILAAVFTKPGKGSNEETSNQPPTAQRQRQSETSEIT